MKNPTKRAIAYIRVSTAEQSEKFGAEAQREAIDKYAKDNGYEIVSYHEEIGSGATERPVLEGIVYGEFVSNPPIEAVIVYKNDRIARDTKLYFYYLYLLEKKGVELIAVQEDFSGIPTEIAGIYRAILQFVAEQERMNIAKRTGAGRLIKAQSGGYSGGRCPYGYRIEDGEYVIDESEAEMVRLIFSCLDGGLSLRKTCETLNMKGYKTRSGNELQPTNVMRIRDNRKLYEGYYKYGDLDWVKGKHEPIINEREGF